MMAVFKVLYLLLIKMLASMFCVESIKKIQLQNDISVFPVILLPQFPFNGSSVI